MLYPEKIAEKVFQKNSRQKNKAIYTNLALP
jgi:hypothetical protein